MNQPLLILSRHLFHCGGTTWFSNLYCCPATRGKEILLLLGNITPTEIPCIIQLGVP
jgi:hypothetical protein